MKPANTALSGIDLGTPALRWPEMERVTIPLDSPDESGAVAYYFDTLAPVPGGLFSDPTIELIGSTGKAACSYLLGLVRAKGLQLVRGPFLTMAPEHGPVPDGWWMVRALVWVEEFDHLVPTEVDPEHRISIQPADKMDAAGLFQAVCSCGNYRSAPTVRHQAVKRGREHQLSFESDNTPLGEIDV